MSGRNRKNGKASGNADLEEFRRDIITLVNSFVRVLQMFNNLAVDVQRLGEDIQILQMKLAEIQRKWRAGIPAEKTRK